MHVSCLMRTVLLEPRRQSEGSCETGSVHPSVPPSFHPSFCLSRCFLGIESLGFSKLWHDARNPYEVVCGRAAFSRKKYFAPKIGKIGQKWAKNRVFEYIEKFCYKLLLNLFYIENVYYLLCSCTNSIFGKILVPAVWAKMFTANQIAGFFNQHISKIDQIKS